MTGCSLTTRPPGKGPGRAGPGCEGAGVCAGAGAEAGVWPGAAGGATAGSDETGAGAAAGVAAGVGAGVDGVGAEAGAAVTAGAGAAAALAGGTLAGPTRPRVADHQVKVLAHRISIYAQHAVLAILGKSFVE